MAKRLLLISLMLACVGPLGAQETAVEGLHIDVLVEEDSGGVLADTALRAAAIALLRSKLPEVVIDETALLTLYIAPVCLPEPDGDFCSLDLSLKLYRQDNSPFRNVTAEMLYWSAGTLLGGPRDALSDAIASMTSRLDEPVAVWLSLDEATRTCWRDYFNANTEANPLSPC